MRRPGMMDPEPPTTGRVSPIADTAERAAEAGPLGMLVALGERDAGLQRELVEVGGAHLLGAEPVPVYGASDSLALRTASRSGSGG